MYKVFIDDNVFFASINAKKTIFNKEVFILPSEKAHQVFDLVKTSQFPVLINFFSEKKCWKFFSKYFTLISAAGGVVRNKKGELLFIYRNGFWDLPKGKIEKNEKETVILQRRAIRIKIEIKKGEKIVKENIFPLRPCPIDAYPLQKIDRIIGKKAKRKFVKGDYIKLSDFK